MSTTTRSTASTTKAKGRKATQRVPKKLLHHHGTGAYVEMGHVTVPF